MSGRNAHAHQHYTVETIVWTGVRPSTAIPSRPVEAYRELTLGTKAKDGLTEMKNLNEIATSAPCRHP
jgi:hypothetical protein